ncbi:hypothetical protein, partial [Patiriisocius hiemis]
SGNESFTAGSGTSSDGDFSIAMGNSNSIGAAGDNSATIGSLNNVTGPNAIALGTNNIVSGQGAFAGGSNNTASGQDATAFNNSTASGTFSFAAIAGNASG